MTVAASMGGARAKMRRGVVHKCINMATAISLVSRGLPELKERVNDRTTVAPSHGHGDSHGGRMNLSVKPPTRKLDMGQGSMHGALSSPYLQISSVDIEVSLGVCLHDQWFIHWAED